MEKLRERIIAYILVFCTLVSAICTGITMPVSAEEESGAQVNMELSYYSLEIWDDNSKTWIEFVENSTVRNGDSIRIGFNWAQSNSDTTTKLLYADIPSLLGIVLKDNASKPLPDRASGTKIGNYWVDENKMWIELTESWYIEQTGGRRGGATIYGSVYFEGKQNGEDVEFKIGDTTVHATFSSDEWTPTSGASIEKKAIGYLTQIQKEDGGVVYRQTYQIKIYTWNGAVKEILFDDSLGAGLDPDTISEFTVKESNCDLFKKGDSCLLKDVKEKLETATLGEAGQTYITFEYTVDVKSNPEYVEGALAQNPGENYVNTATLQYTDSNDGTGKSTSSAVVQTAQPSIKKEGTLSANRESVIWKITIDLNGMSWGSITSITDIPGAGLERNGQRISLPLDITEYEEISPGVYVYTYTENISSNAVGKTVSNTVEMVTDKGNTYPATGSVTLPDDYWITKVATGSTKDSQGNMYINWKVTMKIPEGVTNIRLGDNVDLNIVNAGQHEICGNIYIQVDGGDKKLIISDAKMNGTWLTGKVEDTTIVKNIVWDGILFEDSLAGSTIVVYYQTKVTDSNISGKQFANYAEGKYNEFINGPEHTFKDYEIWEDNSAISKEGKAGADSNTINYILKVDLQKIKFPEEYKPQDGDAIILQDILPDGLEFDKNIGATIKDKQVNLYQNKEQDLYYPQIGNPSPSTVSYQLSADERTVTFTVPVTNDLLKIAQWQELTGWDTTPYLFIYYTLKVKDAEAFIKKGETQDFSNSVSGTFNGSSIGSDETTTALTPQPVVTKKAVYDGPDQDGKGGTAPYVYYEVEVNKGAIDLLAGDTLEATDNLGSALFYDLSSIQVLEVRDGEEQDRELQLGAEYKYTYDIVNNSLSFTLPDAMHLKIKYRALVLLEYSATNNPQLGKDNSKNTFSLSDFNSSGMKAETYLNSDVIKSDAWADGETVGLSIYKYCIEDGSVKPMTTAVFRIVAVKEQGDGWIETSERGEPFEDLKTKETGVLTQNSLVRGQVYKLEETTAPAGYAPGKDLYFVIPDEETKTEELMAKGVMICAPGEMIPYENVLERTTEQPTTGTLMIQKTVEGDLDQTGVAEVIEKIRFRVKKDNEVIEGSLKLTENKGAYFGTISGLAPGVYTVEETVVYKDGYTCSTSYTVSVDSNQQGGDDNTVASAKVEAGKTTTVHFTNTYEKLGSLTIQKTVSGALNWTGATTGEGTVRFEVKDSSGTLVGGSAISARDFKGEGDVRSYTISGLKPDTYTVTEIVETPDGYTCTTSYTVSVGSDSQGGDDNTEASAEVVAGKTTTVHFTNDYASGSLTIQKTIKGDHNLAWDTIKKGLSFEIYVAGEVEEGKAIATIAGSDLVRTSAGDDNIYTYTIPNLEPGEYTVKEFAAVEVSENGKKYVLSEVTYKIGVDPETDYTEGKSATPVLVENGGNITVAFCNTYEENVGTLVLQKSVIIKQGTDGNAESEAAWNNVKGSLEFKIYAYNTQTLKYDNLVETIDGNKLNWNSEDGVASIELSVESGKYMVVEIRKELNGYTWENTSYIVEPPTKEESTEGEGAAFELNIGGEVTVAITNTYSQKRGNLILTKTFEGENLTEEQKNSIEFTITSGAKKIGTYKLSDFPEKTPYKLILELPIGEYVVKETVYDVKGYITKEVSYTYTEDDNESEKTVLITYGKSETDVENPKVIVEDGKDIIVAYTDNYVLPDPDQGSLTLKKTVTGALEWSDVAEKLHFVISKVKPEGGEEIVGEYTISNVPSKNDINQVWKQTIYLEPGQYIVKEVWDGKVGYTCTATYEVKEDGTNRKLGPDSDSATVTITKDKNIEVAVENSYVQEKGYLEITKTVDGVPDELAKENIVFTVTNITTGEETQYTLKEDFTYNEADQKYTLKLNAIVGNKYMVEEAYAIDGFITQIVKYKIDGGADIYLVQNGNTAGTNAPTVVVNAQGQPVRVAYTDAYAKKPSLVLEKSVEGFTWNEVEKYISFTVKGPSYPNGITINASDFDEKGGAHTYTFTALEPGKYTIAETVTDIMEGYTCTTTYNVDADGDAAYVSLEAGKDSTVEVTNTYKPTGSESPDKTPDETLTESPSDSNSSNSSTSSSQTQTSSSSSSSTTSSGTSSSNNAQQQAPAPSQSQPPAQPSNPAPSSFKQLEVSPTPSPSKAPSEDGNVLGAERDRVPQTSDYFYMWLSLFIVSMCSLMGYLVYLDKKNRKV